MSIFEIGSCEAIILDREATGDLDSRFALFTKRFGKLMAKAKSVRKITSKLSGHLEPGNLVQARLIEKNGLQVVDALKAARLKISTANLYYLNLLLAEAEPDLRLWQELISGNFSWPNTLKILGWDPAEVFCQVCEERPPAAFSIQSQEFFCGGCSLKSGKGELLYLNGIPR